MTKKFPTCEQCGDRLSPSNMSKKPGLCVSCYNYLKTGEQKRCIICRKLIKPGERVVRQQVGSIGQDGNFRKFETLWYQHAKCRTKGKPAKKNGNSASR